MQTTTPRLGRRPLPALVACVIACLGMLVAGAAPAAAHAALTGSDPKQGAVVRTPPAEVSLTFSEEVSMSADSLRVLDPRGTRVDTGSIKDVGDDTYRVALKTGLPQGTFTVAYQVISADSHPVSGAYTFSIGAPSDTSASLPSQQAGGGPVGVLYDIARYASYAGFILLVGGAAFVLACWRRGAGVRPVQRLVVSGWIAITAATLALLLMRGSYTGSGKVADIFDLGLLGDVLQTKEGAALVSRLLLLAVTALFVAVLFGAFAKRQELLADGTAAPGAADADAAKDDATSLRDLRFGLSVGGVVVAIGLAATWALSEHASVGMQTGLAMPVDIVHLLAVATWLGGLAALLTALYRAPSIESGAVRRFSAVAFTSVVTLAATGLYQSWRQVGSWSALTGTTFGRLLLAKVALVAVIVVIAFFSRRWTGRLAQPAVAEPERAKESLASTSAKASGGASGKHPAAVSASAASAAPLGTRTPADTAKTTASTEPEAGTGTGTGTGKNDTAGGGIPARGGAAGKKKDAAPGDARAAQLSRQQAAKDAVRRKRIRDADPARSGLRRSVLAETVVAVALLGVTTALTTTETGRTAEEAAHSSAAAPAPSTPAKPVLLHVPFDTGGTGGQGMVLLRVTPSRPGRNDLHIEVMDLHGKPIDIPEVTASLTLKSRDIGPLRITPRHSSTGNWTASGVQIPMSGLWEIAVTVRTSDIDEVTIRKNAQIG